jgi:hypothetical protein
MKVIIYICFISILFFCSELIAANYSITERYIALAIQGDLKPALHLLAEVDSSSSASDQELAAKFHQRFVQRSESPSIASGNALVDLVVAEYRDYWAGALLQTAERTANAMSLETSLIDTLREQGGLRLPPTVEEDTWERLRQAVADRGFYVLVETAPPLQDLLIWRKQTEKQFEIELTDQVATVNVVFMSDFYSLGWKHFAALGLASTTGWVDQGTLYCVEWVYAEGTETFEVSYLKHESRHLADLERFPGLSAADLEYRAKLTELAFATRTQRRLLDDFTIKGAAGSESPHAQANHRVTHDLWRELYGSSFPGGTDAWMTVSRDKVNRAARRLLVRDTKRAERRDESTAPL